VTLLAVERAAGRVEWLSQEQRDSQAVEMTVFDNLNGVQT